MRYIFLVVLAIALVVIMTALVACRTDYYPPNGEAYTKVNDKIYGAVKREGLAPWSEGNGKNMPLSHISVIGK